MIIERDPADADVDDEELTADEAACIDEFQRHPVPVYGGRPIVRG
ncbi:MAG TPA: hypothetical protein VI248_20330 [Kineosporiaceae bacterium]